MRRVDQLRGNTDRRRILIEDEAVGGQTVLEASAVRIVAAEKVDPLPVFVELGEDCPCLCFGLRQSHVPAGS